MEQTIQILRTFEKEQLINAAKKATAKMFADYDNKSVKEEEPVMEKVKGIVDIIVKSDFGCKRESVIKLCEALTGEKLMEYYNKINSHTSGFDFEFEMLACFIMKKKIDGFNVDEAVLVTNTEGYGYTVEGLKSNGTDDYDEESYDNDHMNAQTVRPATDEEIETFIGKLYPMFFNE